MSRQDEPAWAATLAMVAAAAMIAHHVGGKAVRDALFLTSFPVTALPKMVMAASAFSIVSVFATSRAMARIAPWRLVPGAFAASGVLQLVIWSLLSSFPAVCAVLEYLLIVGLGSLLTSGFWSILNERLDPRSAKKYVGRIAGAGTLGGIIGGVIAERVAAMLSLPAMLPLLAGYHLLACVVLILMRPRGELAREEMAQVPGSDDSGWRILKDAPYLRTVAVLVVLGTVSAAMIDYVFKSQAAAYYGKGDSLLRFFAIFYGAAGVFSFLVQTGASGFTLGRLGVAKTVGTLPLAVSAGGLAALVVPGLVTATLARAMEAVFRGSLFRAGYELFYTPMPKREKRIAKPIVDVGFDRLGDAVGSGFVSLLLGLGAVYANPAILTVAILVALAGLWVASRLHVAYIGALERGLLERGEHLDMEDPAESVAISGMLESFTLPGTGVIGLSGMRQPTAEVRRSVTPSERHRLPEEEPLTGSVLADPVVHLIADIRTGDEKRVRRAIAAATPLAPFLIPHVIQLLAWDKVYPDALRLLRDGVDRHAGQLVDALLDPDTEFTVRRRIPKVLHAAKTERAIEGLLLALGDRRFEVRYQCGKALAVMRARQGKLEVREPQVFEVIRREVAVSRAVWESHRLLDGAEETEGEQFVDDFLKNRASRSLEHVFTLLSLVLPNDPLRIAFHGLHTDDTNLRGTALEYLESILPPDIRQKLWPLLERTEGPIRPDGRPRDVILEELLRSNQSILVNLEEMKKRSRGGGA